MVALFSALSRACKRKFGDLGLGPGLLGVWRGAFVFALSLAVIPLLLSPKP